MGEKTVPAIKEERRKQFAILSVQSKDQQSFHRLSACKQRSRLNLLERGAFSKRQEPASLKASGPAANKRSRGRSPSCTDRFRFVELALLCSWQFLRVLSSRQLRAAELASSIGESLCSTVIRETSMGLAGKKIVLGVTGGIAAYKAPTLVRRLRQAGADVQVVMTRAAMEFVAPTALAAVAGRPPRESLFDLHAEAAMGHIELARWADVVLIAPATAHSMAQIANGLASDLLTTLCLASRAPLVLVPAMNNAMWEAAATQANLGRLSALGHTVMPPESGEQACGEVGPGRMPEPEAIVQFLNRRLSSTLPLKGLKVLVTAGPTREAIDPVRFISNHSSGKQGYALATEARELGAFVTLVTGPTALIPPANVRTVQVISARQMLDAVIAELPGTDLFIGVAAVADYRAREVLEQKIKRIEKGIDAIELVPNPDIIATVAASAHRPRMVVGFAAETEDVLNNARAKLLRKKLDAIIVNDVSNPTIGFNSDNNAATLVLADEEVFMDARPKAVLARDVLLKLRDKLTGGLAPTNPEAL